MANSDIIKIGFDYRASLAQFEKDTNGVFDGISNKAGKQKITIQLDAKDDKVIDKIKELQKLKLDKFTFEFGDSGLKEQLQTFDKLESKINEIINLGKGKSFIDSSSTVADIGKIVQNTNNQAKAIDKVTNSYKNQAYELASVLKMLAKLDQYGDVPYAEAFSKAVKSGAKSYKNGDDIQFAAKKYGMDEESIKYLRGLSVNLSNAFNYTDTLGLDTANITDVEKLTEYFRELLKEKLEFNNTKLNTSDIEELIKALGIAKKELFDDGTKSGRNIYGDGTLDKYSDLPQIIQYLKQQETQTIATAEAEQKLAEAQKETVSNTSNSNNSQIEELKSDIQEVKTELGDVKDRISSIESNGFENVRDDVEKTKESVKELNSELTEMKANLSSTPQESNISSASTPAIEQQNKLQEELKETQQQAENTAKAILKVTGYRGTNGGDPVTSNKSGATFWDSKKNVANMYGTSSSDKTLWSSELSFTNPFTFDAKKQKYGDITYLGDGADYDSREIIELTQRENELRKALDNSTKSGLEEVKMAYELQDVCQRITKISKDTSNPYGTHSTDWFAEYAKNNGYDGVAITNVLDTPDSYAKNGTEVSDVYITFQREQLQNTTLLAKANHELAESEREVALAELGVTQNKATSSNNSLEDKIKSIFTDAKELKQILESLYNGKYFSFDTSENDDALGRVRELQKILEDYGYKIKNFKDDSEAFCVSGVISSLEEENNVLDKNTKKIKENQQMRSQNQKKDAFPDKDISASVESATNSIKEENNVLEQNTQKVKENTQAKEQNANVNLNKYDKRLDSYQGKINKYDTTIKRFEDGGWTSNAYLENVQAVKNAVKEYETLLNELKGKDASLVTSDDIQNLDKYEKKIKDTIATVTNMSASEKGYNFVSGQKELDKIHKLLNENSKMSSEAKAKIKAYYAEIESGNPSMSIDKIHGEILKIYNAEVEAGRAGRTLWDTLKNSGFHQIAAQMAGMIGVYDVINVVKEGINTVRELDTAMTEVRKVSDATEAQYASFRDTVSSTAKEIASTNKELLNSSADFLRLGYSLEQAEDLAKNATLFVNVGDGVDITEATEDMITAMKAFDIQAEDSIKIVDDYNQIGNKYALSATDIGEAMKRSASALEVGNNSFEESIGLITAMNEIVQNSENTGNSLKVLSLRLRGAKAELEDMGEDTDGLCDSTSKLREQVKALSGVDIMEDDNTFKSTAQQVKELGEAFVKLDDVSQAALLEIIAGKSRSNAVAALLKNYQQIDNVIADLDDAEGSALRENEAIVDSIDGRIKVLSATAEEFWQKFIDTDFVKNAVSLASDLLGLLTQIIDKFGTLPTIATGVGAALSFKNVGIDTLVAY